VTLFVISIIIFGAVELLPGDIAQAVLGQGATEENLAAMREQMGLNRPAVVRYLQWLKGSVVGDFGSCLISQTPVTESIGPRFRNTLFLALYAAVIAVPVAIILGVLVALFRNSVFDRVANVTTLTSISSPWIVETPMLRETGPDGQLAAYLRPIYDAVRPLAPEEIAAAVVALVEDDDAVGRVVDVPNEPRA